MKFIYTFASMSKPKVAVVLLNWNGKTHLQNYLPSILKSTYSNLEIVVGDNASTDGSVKWLTENHPSVTIIENDKNYGFAGGYNKILNRVDADYFVLLNTDVNVSPDWIEPVISLMETDSQIAACQPDLLDFNRPDYYEYSGAAGGFMDKLGYLFCRGRLFDTIEKKTDQYTKATQIFWACGAAFFIRTSCWKAVKGLDERLFAHMEEVDLCWRLQHLGYKIFACPQSVVYHVGGGTLKNTNPFKTYLNFRNNLIVLHKNLPANKLYITIFMRFWLDALAWIKFLFSFGIRHAFAINKAHFHYLKGLKNWQKDRKELNPKKLPFGIYKKSIVWQFFINKKRTFSALDVNLLMPKNNEKETTISQDKS